MYHLTISGQSERFATLIEVFAFCDDHPLCLDTTTLISGCLGDLPVTTLNGRLSVRILGSAAEVVRRLFSEVRNEYIFDGTRQREPYEVEPRFWRLIRKVLGLTHEPQRIFSQEQIATFGLVKGGLWAIANDVLKEVFGFGNGGPVCVGTEGRSLNYAAHLGAALLANVPVAKAVIDAFNAERDMKRLLYKLDLPDSINRSSKLALEETLGVKLLGLRANASRRALFAMCCFDEVQQLRIEADIGGTVTKQRLLCAKVIARKRAASTMYSQPDGETLNGAEHVERTIAEGCTDLLIAGRGASKRYRLAREGGLAAPVRAKDGTLDYARFLLAAI